MKAGRKMAKKKAKTRTIKGGWSKSDVSLLKKLFPNNPTAEIAGKLGRLSIFTNNLLKIR